MSDPSQSSSTAAFLRLPSGATRSSLAKAPSTPANPSPTRLALPPRSTKSCAARSSASETGLPDGCESHGLRARSRFMTMALSSEVDSALLEVPARVK